VLQHLQKGTIAAGTTLTVANGATTAGSLLAIRIGCRAATQNSISTVTGGWTNSYSTNSLANDGSVWCGYILNASARAASAFLITAAVSGSIEYQFWEVSGIAATSAYYANQVATGNSTSPTVTSSASVTAGDFTIASIYWPNGNDTIGSLSAGWTTDPTIQGTATGQSSSLQPAWIEPGTTAAQTFAGTISPSAANWVAHIEAFHVSGGAGAMVTDLSTASQSFAATVSGGGGSGSQNPWLHGGILRGDNYPSGYQSAYGGLDVNQGGDGAVIWSDLQSTLHGPILGAVGPPNYTGTNQIEQDILACRAYNTSVGANCTTPWSKTNQWQGAFLRIMSGYHSASYALCLGASSSGTTNLRGTWASGQSYAVNDAVLFTITVTYPTSSTTTTTWTGQAGFVCTTGHTSSNANEPPVTPKTGSPAINTLSASNTWWTQVSFFMSDPNFNNGGQCPRFWTAEVVAAWFDFESKLAALYDPAPEVIQVEPCLFMTIYAERCLRQITGSWDTANLVAAGYVTGNLNGSGSILTDTAGQFNELTMRKNLSPGWATTEIGMALNPYQTVNASGTGGGNSNVFTQALASQFKSLFGTQGVLGNNSYRADYIAITTTTGQSLTTVSVANTAVFAPGPGFIAVINESGGAGTPYTFILIPFTGISGNTFTGCSGIPAGIGGGLTCVGVSVASGAGATYQQMYIMMAQLGAPLGIQTSVLAKMWTGQTTPNSFEFAQVLGAAAAMGCTYVEIPNGFNNAYTGASGNGAGVSATQLGLLSAAFPTQPAGGGSSGATAASGAVSGSSFAASFTGPSACQMSDLASSAETITANVSNPSDVTFTLYPTIAMGTQAPAQTTML